MSTLSSLELLSARVWQQPEKLVHRTMLGMIILVGAGYSTALIFGDQRMLDRMLVSSIIYLTGFVIVLRTLRQGRLATASNLVIATIWLANTSQLIMGGSFRQGQGLTYIIILALASILVSAKATVLVGILSMGAVVTGYYLELSPLTPAPARSDLLFEWGILVVSLAVATYILQVVVTTMAESFTVAQENNEKMVLEQRRLLAQMQKRRETERSLQEANEALAATHRRLEERVERRARQLAQANQDLETLLYVTSHDLREPLRAIQNFSQIILRRHMSELGEDGSQRLVLVAATATRLDSLIEDILTLSRAQRLIEPAAVIPAAELVGDALRRLQKEIAATKAIIEVAPDLPEIFVDRSWVVEAIYHLTLNAIQYSKENTPPIVTINGTAGPAGPQLIISDQGIGIPDHQQKAVFKMFHKTAASDPNSIGTGLTLVKQIMEKHGGTVKLSSTLGQGTTVHLAFPLAPQ